MSVGSTITSSQGFHSAAPDRQVSPPGSPGRALFPPFHRVRAGESDFACLEAGKGEPLIFIHGSLGTFLDFAPAVRHFARSYRSIAYSRRFHPPNAADDSDREYTIARHADDLDAVLRELHVESAHVVGSSWGAYVALFLALRQPDRVRTLVLGEPPILPLLRRCPAGRNLLAGFHREVIQPSLEALRHGRSADGVRTFVDGVSGRSGSFDALPRNARQLLLLSSAELRRELETPSPAYMPDMAIEALNALKLPVLLLGGERSMKMFRLITDELDLAIPTAERVLVPRTGHMIHTGNPEEYFRVVGQFLHKHGRETLPPDSR